MNNNMYSINLRENNLKPHFFQRKIVWPVYAWKAILPSAFTEELDILQKLVLSFAKINKHKNNDILYKLGISKELIQTAKKSCVEKGYLDLDNRLTKCGLQLVDNGMSIEKGMLMNYEIIYIFRDALTGDIIPNFKVSELPATEKKQYDFVIKDPAKYKNKKPTFVDIGKALKIRKQINKITDTLKKDYANEVIESEDIGTIEDLDVFVEEVDWALINEDGELESYEVKSVEDTLPENTVQRNNTFKVISDKPEIYFLDTNLYLDPDLPEKISVVSPFDDNEDDWFTKHLFMHVLKDDKLNEDLQLFMEEAKEELLDKYPFNNHLDIGLLKKYPSIANYDSWRPLRNQIEATTRAYNRLVQGHEDYDTFYMRAQRTLEGVLKYCIEQIPNKHEVINSITKYNFKDSLRRIRDKLHIDIPSNLYSPDFYYRLKSVANNRGISSKDRALFLVFDAYFHELQTPSLQLLKTVPDFYRRINLITNLRNKTAHFTEEEGIETEDFENIKRELDTLLDILIAHYLISRSLLLNG